MKYELAQTKIHARKEVQTFTTCGRKKNDFGTVEKQIKWKLPNVPPLN